MICVVRRRSALEIYVDVLMSVKECEEDMSDGVTGSKPTRIMYASNLAWNPCIRKLEMLVDQGLVEKIPYSEHKTTIIYKTTDEGEKTIMKLGETRRSRRIGYDGRYNGKDDEMYKKVLKELDLILGNSVEKITE